MDRFRVTPVLTADTQVDPGTGFATRLRRDLDELADAALVEGLEHFELFVGAAVLANNLMVIAALLRRKAARRRRPAA